MMFSGWAADHRNTLTVWDHCRLPNGANGRGDVETSYWWIIGAFSGFALVGSRACLNRIGIGRLTLSGRPLERRTLKVTFQDVPL